MYSKATRRDRSGWLRRLHRGFASGLPLGGGLYPSGAELSPRPPRVAGTITHFVPAPHSPSPSSSSDVRTPVSQSQTTGSSWRRRRERMSSSPRCRGHRGQTSALLSSERRRGRMGRQVMRGGRGRACWKNEVNGFGQQTNSLVLDSKN